MNAPEKRKVKRVASEKISISLPEWMVDRLNELTEESGDSRSNVIADAIRAHYGITKTTGKLGFIQAPVSNARMVAEERIKYRAEKIRQ